MPRAVGCSVSTLALALFAGALPAQDSSMAARDTLKRRPRVISSQVVLDSTLFHDLPLTTVRAVLDLQPGVGETRDPRGVSLRGSDPAGTAVYIDGALVTNGNRTTNLLLGTNGIATGVVTLGAVGATVGDAQAGAISFFTPSGGRVLRASLRYRTDNVGFDPWRNVGLNLIEARVGGPVVAGATFFTALTLNGSQSLDAAKLQDVQSPVYIMSGVDTVVREPVAFGNPSSDTVNFAIPRFVQVSGYCDPARNYGVSCQGLKQPFSANGSVAWEGKAERTYGDGSRVSLTGIASRAQVRDFPGVRLYNPSEYTGSRVASSAWIVIWVQRVSPAVTVNANLSRQADDRIAGPLIGQSELASRDPLGGFLLKPLDFLIDFTTTHSVKIAGVTTAGVHYTDDVQVQCLLAGLAYCSDQVPFFQRNDLQESQPFRMNPYGVEQSGLGPFPTSGLETGPTLQRERRWALRGGVEWRTSPSNHVGLGAEARHYDTKLFTSGMISVFAMSAYHEQPVSQALYAEDRLQLADLTLVAGLRWDRFNSRALYPRTPGRISTDTLPLDPTDPTKNFVKASAHSALSPSIQAGFVVSPRLDVWFSAARQVAMPPFEALFSEKNTDLALTGFFSVFGRDLDFTKTTILELGVTGRISDDFSLDAALFTKSQPAEVFGSFGVLANSGLGSVRGVELQVERRFTDAFTASAAYSYHTSADVPVGIVTPIADHHHTIVGTATLAVPDGWRAGSWLGSVFRGTDVRAAFRLTSGAHYTTVMQQGLGSTTDGLSISASPIEPFNASVLPAFKTLDLRVTRALEFGGRRLTAFAESQNLLNWTNILGLYSETGAVTNTTHESRFLAEQTQILLSEASAVGLRTTDARGDPAVDLSAPGICATWQGQSTSSASQAASGPVDCVLLVRAEQRYGNGDGIFTMSEYTRAFSAWYNLANAPYRFYGTGRRIRVGLEVAL